jgi:hypothetical protein
MSPSAIYNNVRYGTTLYGAVLPGDSANLRWAIEIDWNNDGIFDGSNDAEWCVDMSVRRGRQQLLNESGQGIKSIDVGKLSLTLEDENRRYDPRNTGSPLYPNVLPGRLIRIQVRENATGPIHPVFSGRITNIQPVGRRGEVMHIEAEDGIRWLLDQTVSSIIKTVYSVDAAMAQVLANSQWPASWGSKLDNSPDILQYWWTESGTNSWEALQALANFCFGTIWCDASGALCFRMRQSLLATMDTWLDADLLKDVTLPQPWETVRNVIDLTVHPVDPKSLTVLWSLSQQPRLDPMGSISLFGKYQYLGADVAGAGVISPVAGTDWKVTSNPDGSGTDITSQCSILVTIGSTDVIVHIINNAATSGYVSLMQVRGRPVYPVEEVTLRSINNTSVATYGPKLFKIDSPWMQLTPLAQDLLAMLSSFFATPLVFPVVQMEALPTRQFDFDLMDRIQYTSAELDINQAYQIGGLEHTWISQTGQAVRTTFFLEPYYAFQGLAAFWTFPTNIGTTSYFAP